MIANGNTGIVASSTVAGGAVGIALGDYWIHYMQTPPDLENATYVLAGAILGGIVGTIAHLKTRLKADENNNGIPDVLERLQRIEEHLKPQQPNGG